MFSLPENLWAAAPVRCLGVLRFSKVADMYISDPRYAGQWHLNLLGDIEAIWENYSGAGVSVAVYDDGMDQSHVDLAANYDASRHYNGRLYDNGLHDTSEDGHGTSVGGLIAAALNGVGGVGVAWGAQLTSVDYLGTVQSAAWNVQLDVLEYASTFDIVNQSYGVTPDYDINADAGDTGSWAYDEAQAFLYAATNGRDGLGTILVKAAGNEANSYLADYGILGNAQGEAHNTLHTVITVGAFEEDGSVAYYSNYGHNLLISAPAASNTTDRTGSAGYESGAYTDDFGGTSAATPVTAGVIALMLEANPDLGYRDVQTILALSAAQTGSDYGAGADGYEVGRWMALGGETWNGGAMTFHQNYGFGAVDAFAAVRMAEVWGLYKGGVAATQNTQISMSYSDYPNAVIRDNGHADATITVNAGQVIEHVYVTVDIQHTFAADLVVDLITPDGEVINLADREGGDVGIASDWTFGVASLRGMSSDGVWTVRVTDTSAGDTGRLYDVGLEFLGADEHADDIWTVTEDFRALQAVEAARGRFSDTNGGSDTLNAVALQEDVVLSLGDDDIDGVLNVGGAVWARLTDGAIENAATGDGDDRLTGSVGNNTLMAGRGSNVVTGGGGQDSLFGLGDANVLVAEGRGLYGLGASDQVFRLFDTVFGRAPGEAGHQGYTAQLANGQVTLEELAATFITAPEFEARYGASTSNEAFVTLLFQNVFDRDPAPRGLAVWTAELDNGTSRAELVARFSETAEHITRTEAAQEAFDATDPTELAGVVFRLYRAVLDRVPAQGGFLNWHNALDRGVDQADVVALFMESDEFQTRFGDSSNEDFVRLLFNNVLGRQPAQSGLEAWTARLDAGDSRAELVADFMNTPEFVQRTAASLDIFMQGFGEDDTLLAMSETAVLSGGLFADTFQFVAPGTENSLAASLVTSSQVVTDLEAWDRVRLDGFGYDAAHEALDHFRQDGDDVIFADHGMTITFLDTDLAMIDAEMISLTTLAA